MDEYFHKVKELRYKKGNLQQENGMLRYKGNHILTVAMVIPLFFSSGALSISSKATALAFPSSARTYGK